MLSIVRRLGVIDMAWLLSVHRTRTDQEHQDGKKPAAQIDGAAGEIVIGSRRSG
jgi:hypothetical protein